MKIYFAGSIRAGDESLDEYAKIIEHLKTKGEVLTEHLWKKKADISDKEIYERDVKWLKKSNVVCAEVSTPSLGVGYELRLAESLGKKVLCLYKLGSPKKLSAMINGNEDFVVKDYGTVEEALFFIDTFFDK